MQAVKKSPPGYWSWLYLFAGTAGLWGVVYAFGRFALPIVTPLDRAISEALNPDARVPGVDEFFRALTDYSILLIAVPIVSLLVVDALYRLSRMSMRRATAWALIACGFWWLTLALLHAQLELRAAALLSVAAIPVFVFAVGAALRAFVRGFHAKHWLTGLLCAECGALVILWATRRLAWNTGLPGANYVFLPVLLIAFGGTVYAFHRMDDAMLARYIRMFWLVALSILLVDQGASERLKRIVGRPRPLNEANAPWNKALRIIPDEALRGKNSFPSGHVSGTFALLTPLFWWARDRRVRTGLLAWCALQAAARVYTAAHFTSDCLMGAVLGFGIGTLVFFLCGGPALRSPPARADTPA